MSDLSPDLARLLAELGRVHEPTAADEERVLAALQLATAATLAVAGGAASGATTSAGTSAAAATGALGVSKAAVHAGLGAKLAAVLLAVSGVATGLAVWRGADDPTTPPRSTVVQDKLPGAGVSVRSVATKPAPEAPVSASGAPLPLQSGTRTAPVPDAAAERRHGRPGRHSVPSASAELALVRAAQAALRDSAPERALVLLDQYTRRFPQGVLREEQRAVRVLALCANGQHVDGREARAAFLKASPNSPLVARVAGACGVDEPEP